MKHFCHVVCMNNVCCVVYAGLSLHKQCMIFVKTCLDEDHAHHFDSDMYTNNNIMFEKIFIITQLAIRLTSTFRPPSAAFFRN